MNKTELLCLEAGATLEKCVGSFIDQIELCMDYDNSDRLAITLTQVRELGEVTISLERVRRLELDKAPKLGTSFVDGIRATHLPRLDEPWPAEALAMVRRFNGLPDLIWFEVIGPTSVEVVCETMSWTATG